MLKSQGVGCSTRVAPATLCHLQRPSLGRGINAGVSFPFWNNPGNKQKAKSISNGRLRLVSREIKAALTTVAEPTTTVLTKVIVKKITGEITSSTLLMESKALDKLLKLEFASILVDPSKLTHRLCMIFVHFEFIFQKQVNIYILLYNFRNWVGEAADYSSSKADQ